MTSSPNRMPFAITEPPHRRTAAKHPAKREKMPKTKTKQRPQPPPPTREAVKLPAEIGRGLARLRRKTLRSNSEICRILPWTGPSHLPLLVQTDCDFRGARELAFAHTVGRHRSGG